VRLFLFYTAPRSGARLASIRFEVRGMGRTKRPQITVKRVRIDTLHEDPANARAHSRRNLDAIVASLRRFGQQRPIIVTPEGMVLAGNARLRAARELGWEEIDVVVTTLEGFRRVAFAIAHNRSQELSRWEHDALRAVVDVIENDPELLEAAGFTAGEVVDLRALWAGPDLSDADIGEYDPSAETYTVKVADVREAEASDICDRINQALDGSGYACKVA
jgi:hypothetical protein